MSELSEFFNSAPNHDLHIAIHAALIGFALGVFLMIASNGGL